MMMIQKLGGPSYSFLTEGAEWTQRFSMAIFFFFAVNELDAMPVTIDPADSNDAGSYPSYISQPRKLLQATGGLQLSLYIQYNTYRNRTISNPLTTRI